MNYVANCKICMTKKFGTDLVSSARFEPTAYELEQQQTTGKINDNVISDEKFEINKNLFKDNYLKLSLGKKRHIKIELN